MPKMALPTYIQKPQTQYEMDIVGKVTQKFKEMQVWRNTFANQWQEISELILPNFKNTFYYGNYNFPGEKKTYRQIDSSGQLALARYTAILDSLLTPSNSFWLQLGSDDEAIMRDRPSRLWFEQATKILFRERYSPTANFKSQNLGTWEMLGAFGTAGLLIDELDDQVEGKRGLRYKSIPLGELFLSENHQGVVDTFVRWFKLSPRQACQKWENCPPSIKVSRDKNSETPLNFLHWVGPRGDFEPGRIDAKGKPWASYYVSIETNWLLQEGGYRTFPVAIARGTQAPNEIYGRGPAVDVLPALKTLNAQKATYLKQAHRAADPILLLQDDGLYDFNLRPGSMNKGGVSPDGKLLVQTLPTGNIQVNEKMMEMERALIDDTFLVSLFKILEDTNIQTATQVIEQANQRAILLGPAVGKQHDYLGQMTHRELDVLSYLGMLPPMPPRLREARGAYKVTYTSPIAKAMRAQEAAGFIRALETVKELVNITQDQSLLDPFNFAVAVPAIADIQAVPASWMATAEEMKAKGRARAQARQAQQQIQALPAQAAMIKAQAAVQKNQPGIAPGQQGLGGPVQPGQGGPRQGVAA